MSSKVTRIWILYVMLWRHKLAFRLELIFLTREINHSGFYRVICQILVDFELC